MELFHNKHVFDINVMESMRSIIRFKFYTVHFFFFKADRFIFELISNEYRETQWHLNGVPKNFKITR